MLSKQEKLVMQYIFDKCKNKSSVLISPDELCNMLAPKYEVGKIEIDEIINNLVLENYITMVLSDKKGKPIYCMSLDKKGESFERDIENSKKTTIKLVVRTVALAVLSFVVGLILKAIFS